MHRDEGEIRSRMQNRNKKLLHVEDNALPHNGKSESAVAPTSYLLI